MGVTGFGILGSFTTGVQWIFLFALYHVLYGKIKLPSTILKQLRGRQPRYRFPLDQSQTQHNN